MRVRAPLHSYKTRWVSERKLPYRVNILSFKWTSSISTHHMFWIYPVASGVNHAWALRVLQTLRAEKGLRTGLGARWTIDESTNIIGARCPRWSKSPGHGDVWIALISWHELWNLNKLYNELQRELHHDLPHELPHELHWVVLSCSVATCCDHLLRFPTVGTCCPVLCTAQARSQAWSEGCVVSKHRCQRSTNTSIMWNQSHPNPMAIQLPFPPLLDSQINCVSAGTTGHLAAISGQSVPGRLGWEDPGGFSWRIAQLFLKRCSFRRFHLPPRSPIEFW